MRFVHSARRLRALSLTLLAFTAAFGTATAAQAAVTISDKPTSNMNCSGGVCTPTAKKAVLNVGDLATMLATGDVKVVSNSQSVDMKFAAPLSWTRTSRLTLDSYRSIVFQQPVSVTGIGALTITTNDGGSGGDFSFENEGHIQFWDLRSSLITNGTGFTLVFNIKQLAHAVISDPAGNYALAKPYNASKDGIYAAPPVGGVVGIVEGLGNAISNLSVNNSSDSGTAGLFDTNQGAIRDLGVTKVNISSAGGLYSAVGGLLANNFGSVVQCFATGKVRVGDIGEIGGLVGANIGGGLVSKSFASIEVAAGANAYSGGLVGENEGQVDRSYASGTVTGGRFAGGLVGSISQTSGIITLSHASGAVSGNGNVGGLIGVAGLLGALASIDQSFATGDVSGTGNVGGLAGWVPGANSVADSYATGAVSGTDGSVAGGLIGESGGFITENYSAGSVTAGGGSTIGGFIGNDIGHALSADYWDLDTSGISDPAQGAGNVPNDPGIKGLSDTKLKSELPKGFDPKIWGQKRNINNGYPYLLANPPKK